MKLIVDSETDSKVIDDCGNVMYSGNRISCVEFIADRIEENLERNRGSKFYDSGKK